MRKLFVSRKKKLKQILLLFSLSGSDDTSVSEANCGSHAGGNEILSDSLYSSAQLNSFVLFTQKATKRV